MTASFSSNQSWWFLTAGPITLSMVECIASQREAHWFLVLGSLLVGLGWLLFSSYRSLFTMLGDLGRLVLSCFVVL